MGTSHLTLRQLKIHYFAVYGVFGYLYAILVIGIFGMVGNYVSGQLAETGLIHLYRSGFACAVTGFVLVCLSLAWSRTSTRTVAVAGA